jgi:hypothetical protein
MLENGNWMFRFAPGAANFAGLSAAEKPPERPGASGDRRDREIPLGRAGGRMRLLKQTGWPRYWRR